MRKVLLAALVLVAVVPQTALAASDTDQATLSVTVPETISITFSDAAADFGTVGAGSTATQLDTLAYEVATNVAAGFTVDINKAGFSSFDGFSLSKDDFATAGTPVPVGGAQPVATDWRSETASGTFNYTDDVRVTVSSAQAANSYAAVLDYIAVSN